MSGTDIVWLAKKKKKLFKKQSTLPEFSWHSSHWFEDQWLNYSSIAFINEILSWFYNPHDKKTEPKTLSEKYKWANELHLKAKMRCLTN